VRRAPGRTLAAAGIAGTGAAAAVAAYLEVGGLPGMLYAAGICMAAFLGALAIYAGRRTETPAAEPAVAAESAPRQPRWRRKKHIIAELQLELATTREELEEHRRALANLATQLSRETEAAQRNAERLEQRIRELEAERDSLLELVAGERERFEQTLDDLGGGIGRHGNELAALERELEALIAR
jgi:flagellar motility protein MotE (MotC chaperone)